MWNLLAKFLARPRVADWLIRRAMRTPYLHLIISARRDIYATDSPAEVAATHAGERWYMRRYWLFRLGPLQARVHHILAEDPGRDLHNHPWPFRTFILRGWYVENRHQPYIRQVGQTYRMGPNEYHRISDLDPDGAWTLFITFGKRAPWGFKVGGQFVPHEEY